MSSRPVRAGAGKRAGSLAAGREAPRGKWARTPAAEQAAEAGAPKPRRGKPAQAEILLGDGETTAIAEHASEVRAHLSRMRRADDLLEAYALPRNATGVLPSSELAKARAARDRAVGGIVASMDALAACMAQHGRLGGCEEDGIEAESIFCAACGGYECAPGNDILLCDMAGCEKAYHQACVRPALPDGVLEAEEWFCPVCEALDELLDAVNEYLGQSWGRVADMFPEARRRAAGQAGQEERSGGEEEEEEADEDYVDSDRSSEPASAPDSDGGGEDGPASPSEKRGASSSAPSSESGEGTKGSSEELREEAPLGPRRPRVDYAALAEELFGGQEDEDADPAADTDFTPRGKGGRGGPARGKGAGAERARTQPAARSPADGRGRSGRSEEQRDGRTNGELPSAGPNGGKSRRARRPPAQNDV